MPLPPGALREFKLYPTSPYDLYVGVDPGATGGLTIIVPGKAHVPEKVFVFKMPKTEADIWQWFMNLRIYANPDRTMACIEKVTGWIQGQGDSMPASSAFNFGMGYGGLRMALTAASIPFEEPIPRTWQKAFSIPAKGSMTHTEFKNLLKSHAQRLYPTVITQDSPKKVLIQETADSLLIASYCQRKFEGRL